jgi:hypothetical protein
MMIHRTALRATILFGSIFNANATTSDRFADLDNVHAHSISIEMPKDSSDEDSSGRAVRNGIVCAEAQTPNSRAVGDCKPAALSPEVIASSDNPVRVIASDDDGVRLLDSLEGRNANYWFGASAGSSNFLWIASSAQIEFSRDVASLTFDVQRACCTSARSESELDFNAVFLDAHGEIRAYRQFAQTLSAPAGEPSAATVTIDAGPTPFRSIVLKSNEPWLMLKLRYVASDDRRSIP